MQNNNQIENLIIKLFSDTISKEEKLVLQTWINENSDNKKYLLQMQNIWHVAHPAFQPEELNTDKAVTKLLRNIGSVTETKKANVSFFTWWQRIAAILIIPLTIWSFIQLNQKNNTNQNVAFQEITSPLGMKSEVTLSDGSKVWLNSGSKLKYPVVFGTKRREIYLSGEAFFKVHSDKQHPFIVSTKNLKVQATGTAFNVESYMNDSLTAVTLLEGKVDVQIGTAKSEKIVPDQRLVYNNKIRRYVINKTDAQYWCAWKDGILAFRNEPLAEVFKRIGRTYNVDIVVKDKGIGLQPYRATFEGESLDEILRLLKLSAPIKYKRSERKQQSDNEFQKEIIEVYKAK